MGFFGGSKPECVTCGMQAIQGGVCTYCGKNQKSDPTRSKHSQFSDPDRLFREDKSLNQKRTSQKVQAVHQHTQQHEIVSSKKRADAGKSGKPGYEQWKKKQQSKKNAQGKVKNKGCGGGIFYFIAFGPWFSAFVLLMDSFDRANGHIDEVGLEGGIFLGITSFVLFLATGTGGIRRFVTFFVLAASSIALLVKPVVAPWIYNYGGASATSSYVPSYTSETHLYFVIPGALLGFLWMVFVRRLLSKK